MRAALDKIRGCLLGGAAGDALGYPVEFLSARGMKVRYGEEGITEYSLRQGIAVISDDTQMSMEEMMILKEESRILHEKIDKLSLQEQFIIKSIYFDDMKQKDVAEILGVTKGALSQRLNTILRKMRNMYMEG